MLRFLCALWLAKLVAVIGILCGKKSSSKPGDIALKIYPQLITRLATEVRYEIIAVCGTNGKTTTNNLLHRLLAFNGNKVVCNKLGANMLGGIATAFIGHCSLSGRFCADYACLEVDEAFAVKLFELLTPDCMIITNLFRDQLDRYGEVDITAKLLKMAVNKAKTLILNGDDPLTAQFGVEATDRYYFGIGEQVAVQAFETRESSFCAICGHVLSYNYYHYSQLGDFYCCSCGYKRPTLDYEAYHIDMTEGLEFNVTTQRLRHTSTGLYNVYNLLAAYTALAVLKHDTSIFNTALLGYTSQIGRMQIFNFNKPVVLNLSKNPAGFNQAIMSIQNDRRKKDVIISINDNPPDGLDVSWLWDVAFEKVGDDTLNSLTTSGSRLYDVALRFKYADVKVDCITQNIKLAILNSLTTDSEICYILVNYTALFPTHQVLTKLAKRRRWHGFHN